jgi:D-alanyl-D-alanine carboxypeptidase/D-alanyl-D-alanine-endopeptidase (penicillin-binding protein 4)
MSYVKSSASFRRRSRRSRARKRGAFTVALLGVFAIWLIAIVSTPHYASGTVAPQIVQAAPRATAAATSPATITWSAADRKRLFGDLHGAFAPALTTAGAWSFAVLDGNGETIYDDRAAHAVAPASVQKLIVAASALDALGPAYRYHTIFAARKGIGDDGVLDGDLWLVGSGDPSLTSDDLRNGVAMLARSGLRRINGGIMVDASALSGPELNPHWARDDNGQDYAAPVSAVSLDGDTIESHQLVDGVDERVWTPMQNVRQYVAAQTEEMLRARSVTTAAPPQAAVAPLDSVVLWDHRSAPLPSLETHMLFLSDNHYAEQLLRTIGEESAGEADDAGGIAAEQRYLERLGIPTPGLRLYDGSGLSSDNRIAAITLARLLADKESSLYLLLPLGGRQGTLEDYGFTTALGRVRAKSGHLSDVSALAGYVTTLHHGRVSFAFLINGPARDPDTAIVRALDRLVLL